MFSIALYSLKALLRNRATVFFGFAFPLFFIAAFGLIGNSGLSVSIGIPDSSQNGPIFEALSEIETVEIESGTKEELKEKLFQGQIGGVLEIESEKNNSTLYVSQADPQVTGAVTSLVNGVVDKLNLRIAKIDNPPIKLQTEEVSGRSFDFIDFFLPGMIGFALLTTSITSVGFGLVFLKKTLVLKRLFATPIRGYTILLGQGGSRLIFVLAQTLVIIFVGVLVFDFTLINGYITLLQILALSIVGLISFLGFGILVAGIANDENTVAPLANLIVLPQFLVAGTFFPIEALPEWIQPAVKLLPLAFFNTALRKITVEGLNVTSTSIEIVGLAVWAVIAYIAASRTFKWE
jgi:ABC-2 type transport system permease protein